MLKRKILACLLGVATFCCAQTKKMEQLRAAVAAHPQQDTTRVNLLNQWGLEARKSTADDSYTAYTEALRLARSLHYKKGEATALLGLGFYYRFSDKTNEGLENTRAALAIFKGMKDLVPIITCYYNLGVIYNRQANFQAAIQLGADGLALAELLNDAKWMALMNYQLGQTYMAITDVDRAMSHFRKSLLIAKTANDKDGMAHAIAGIAFAHETRKNWDSARIYYEQSRALGVEMNDLRGQLQEDLDIANMLANSGKYREAYSMVHGAIPQFKKLGQVGYLPYCYTVLAGIHLNTGNPDSALYYAYNVLNSATRSGRVITRGETNKIISQAYAKKGDFRQAYRYQQSFLDYRDSLNLNDAIKRSTALQYAFDLEKKQSQISLLTKNEELRARESRQQKILLIGTLVGLLVVIAFSVVLWRNNRLRQKAYMELQRQQAELKATQAQLIQSEKMASLGELTAGIAHEIQNPLNFVNNFAELNSEMIGELKEELARNNIKEAVEIADNIKDNEEKISHHGKRADAIVKGMLAHSRTGSGQKELTDINALCDEYLRLSFHGLRAKDKSFNSKTECSFDDSLPKIAVMQQDLGRVILNLLNNAFYAVNEKSRQGIAGYQPIVRIETRYNVKTAQISISDNGTGIPKTVVQKIFQPFFTTKPTGEGTGLGLSLSYDIITKGHGGQLKMETERGEGTTFILTIPIANSNES